MLVYLDVDKNFKVHIDKFVKLLAVISITHNIDTYMCCQGFNLQTILQ